MLKSRSIEGEKGLLMKRLLAGEVYVISYYEIVFSYISFNEKNRFLTEILYSLQPLHTSVDNYYGKIETAKLFRDLNLLIDEPPDQDRLEKILFKMKPTNGANSETESEDNDESHSSPRSSTNEMGVELTEGQNDTIVVKEGSDEEGCGNNCIAEKETLSENQNNDDSIILALSVSDDEENESAT